mgnify:CR=1 FL=1
MLAVRRREVKKPVSFASQYKQLYQQNKVEQQQEQIVKGRNAKLKQKEKVKENANNNNDNGEERNQRITRSKSKALKAKEAPQINQRARRERPVIQRNIRHRNRQIFRAPLVLPVRPWGNPQIVQEEEEFVEVEVETISSKRRKEGIELKWSTELTPLDFDVNQVTMKQTLPQISELIPLDDVNSNELIQIVKEAVIPEDELQNWTNYGLGRLFLTKESMIPPLQALVDYCETSSQTSKGLKEKLRLVTKILKEDPSARNGILLLLAQHGNVCNVMKEVGVNMAYSLVKNEAKEYNERESIKGKILRQLELLKEIVLEELFRKEMGGGGVNTHPLVGFRNGLAPDVGLDFIPDPNWGQRTASKKTLWSFKQNYTPLRIVNVLKIAVNENPRKISYDSLVEWFQENSPIEDSYEFLTQCFDENGKFTTASLLYLLYKLDILY